LINLDTISEQQNAILIGLELPGQIREETMENLDELIRLAQTAGLAVKQVLWQNRQKINPAYFIGPGKVDELVDLIEKTDSRIIVFDEDLTPAQIRNLENSLEVKIIDRSTLILDIFAKHAQTREAKTQVELAQLQYLLPRLTRQWTHLSRQVGGIGTRGPGETQLETDRRLVRRRIEKLRQDLNRIDNQRSVRRAHREGNFRVTLIGYTNVGKSTIMNLLSGSDLLVEDQLFATLDSTIRKVKLNSKHHILLSDTVGFIRKLPAHLIASFKSTLDEVIGADLLLHVVDISYPHFRDHMQVVMKTLEELGAHNKSILNLFNKIDLIQELAIINSLKTQYPESVFISAQKHIGIEAFKNKLVQIIEKNFVHAKIKVPVSDQKFIHYIHQVSKIENTTYDDGMMEVIFSCEKPVYDQIVRKHSDYSVQTLDHEQEN
jgi:GTP-binding protein HflX